MDTVEGKQNPYTYFVLQLMLQLFVFQLFPFRISGFLDLVLKRSNPESFSRAVDQ